MTTWTKPYCGLTYLGELRDPRWAAIQQYTDGACDVHLMVRGLSFKPHVSIDESIGDAKKRAEDFVNGAVA